MNKQLITKISRIVGVGLWILGMLVGIFGDKLYGIFLICSGIGLSINNILLDKK